MSDTPVPGRPTYGADPTIHHSTSDTRERCVDRARRSGIDKDTARKLAEQATRETHDNLNRRG